MSLCVRVDFSEVEVLRRQLDEVLNTNQLLEAQAKRHQGHGHSEYEEIMVSEVEVQTETLDLEARFKKSELDRTELLKELSHVRKTLFESQKKSLKDKELSQQNYSALVEKYETDS